MTPEIITQVDAWLAGRAPTALSQRWGIFVSSWWYEREKWPADVHATEAAMSGILLALVRGAWDDAEVCIIDASRRAGFYQVQVGSHSFNGDTLGLALAAALMAAPTKAGEP